MAEEKSKLQRLFEAGEFVVTGEIGPPRGADVEHVHKAAEGLRGVIDAANVTDNQTSILRMSSIAGVLLAQQKNSGRCCPDDLQGQEQNSHSE